MFEHFARDTCERDWPKLFCSSLDPSLCMLVTWASFHLVGSLPVFNVAW